MFLPEHPSPRLTPNVRRVVRGVAHHLRGGEELPGPHQRLNREAALAAGRRDGVLARTELPRLAGSERDAVQASQYASVEGAPLLYRPMLSAGQRIELQHLLRRVPDGEASA